MSANFINECVPCMRISKEIKARPVIPTEIEFYVVFVAFGDDCVYANGWDLGLCTVERVDQNFANGEDDFRCCVEYLVAFASVCGYVEFPC